VDSPYVTHALQEDEEFVAVVFPIPCQSWQAARRQSMMVVRLGAAARPCDTWVLQAFDYKCFGRQANANVASKGCE
jgi:hypothetical protein